MGGRSERKVQRRIPIRGRLASPPAAVADLTDEQGHKRLNTLEQSLDGTLPMAPDEMLARDTPDKKKERRADLLNLARVHINRARR